MLPSCHHLFSRLEVLGLEAIASARVSSRDLLSFCKVAGSVTAVSGGSTEHLTPLTLMGEKVFLSDSKGALQIFRSTRVIGDSLACALTLD